jgi:hypothetical protein
MEKLNQGSSLELDTLYAESENQNPFVFHQTKYSALTGGDL